MDMDQPSSRGGTCGSHRNPTSRISTPATRPPCKAATRSGDIGNSNTESAGSTKAVVKGSDRRALDDMRPQVLGEGHLVVAHCGQRTGVTTNCMDMDRLNLESRAEQSFRLEVRRGEVVSGLGFCSVLDGPTPTPAIGHLRGLLWR